MSLLHFLLPSRLLPDFPDFDRPAAVSQKWVMLLKETCTTNGGNGGKMGWHLCSLRKKKIRREGIFFREWGDLVFNQKQHSEIGRKV